MGDFYQTGVIATFHKMGKPVLQPIEAQMEAYARERPIALVLPSLYSELQGEALGRIIEELKEVRYIRQIVVTLGPASEDRVRPRERVLFGPSPGDKGHLE